MSQVLPFDERRTNTEPGAIATGAWLITNRVANVLEFVVKGTRSLPLPVPYLCGFRSGIPLGSPNGLALKLSLRGFWIGYPHKSELGAIATSRSINFLKLERVRRAFS
jgi:hypothetical protein